MISINYYGQWEIVFWLGNKNPFFVFCMGGSHAVHPQQRALLSVLCSLSRFFNYKLQRSNETVFHRERPFWAQLNNLIHCAMEPTSITVISLFIPVESRWSRIRCGYLHVHALDWLSRWQDRHPHYIQWTEASYSWRHTTEVCKQPADWTTKQGKWMVEGRGRVVLSIHLQV